jgi:hypothetical protein
MTPQDHVISHELAGLLWVDVENEGKGNKPINDNFVII